VRNAFNITLTGFMGTGKSAVGRRLAEALGREFVDTDAILEVRERMDVRRIFAEKGEDYFRDLERNLVIELTSRRNLVIAVGGGTILNPENLRRLASSGPVICLTATPETIAGRLGTAQTRPLLAAGAPARVLSEIRRLLEERRAAYGAVPWQVATDGLTVENVARMILRKLPTAVGCVSGKSALPSDRPES
jgi:shikimate kinase